MPKASSHEVSRPTQMEANYIALYGGTYFVPLFIPPLLLLNVLFITYIAFNLRAFHIDSGRASRDWIIWLSLLPIFNLIWLFVVVKHIRTRVGHDKGVSEEFVRSVSRNGYIFAMFNVIASIPIAGAVVLAPVALIFQIRYWLGLKNIFAKCRSPAPIMPSETY